MSKLPKIVLASQSPRRQHYLKQLGVEFNTQPAAINETPYAGESATDFVLRMAQEKAAAVTKDSSQQQHSLPVLAADTVIEFNGEIIGKPSNQLDFLQRFKQMSGRSHWVHTAVAIVYKQQTWQLVTSTQVTFCEIEQQQAIEYWNTGEPCDKAGGYGIQGIGGKFVKSINGSYSSVVGLPLCETEALLAQVASYQASCGEY